MARYYEYYFIGHLFQLPTFMNAIVNLFLMLLPKKMSERYINVGSDETKLVSIAHFFAINKFGSVVRMTLIETGWTTGSETCWTTVWSKV